jgi:hypothetical protein
LLLVAAWRLARRVNDSQISRWLGQFAGERLFPAILGPFLRFRGHLPRFGSPRPENWPRRCNTL